MPPREPTTETAHQPSFHPFHLVPGISNFRDIGGWDIISSGNPPCGLQVRQGVLYRGSDTSRITPDGITTLQSLGIKTDFDLRSRQQIEKTGGFKDMGAWGISRKWSPVFAEEAYTEAAARKRYELYAGDGTDGIVAAFVEILEAGAHMFGDVLRHLLATVPRPGSSKAGVPALFMHCTTGNNRTGVFVSLLLMLLHVPEASIADEYALSELGLAPTRHVNIERLLNKGAFQEYPAEEARRKCERMVGARRESMEALVAEVHRKWGGAEGYFRQDVGLADEEIGMLREVLTVQKRQDTAAVGQ